MAEVEEIEHHQHWVRIRTGEISYWNNGQPPRDLPRDCISEEWLAKKSDAYRKALRIQNINVFPENVRELFA